MITEDNLYQALRTEYNNPAFKNRLKQELGNKCYNCGSSISIEYHHIVPLRLGGTNNISNIVPLCYRCHKSVHDMKNIRTVCRKEKTGRKRKPAPENFENVMFRYTHGDIGMRECRNLLKLSSGNKLSDMWFYKQYLSDHGIKTIKNRIDMLNTEKCKRANHEHDWIAKIIYKDGTEEISYS